MLTQEIFTGIWGLKKAPGPFFYVLFRRLGLWPNLFFESKVPLKLLSQFLFRLCTKLFFKVENVFFLLETNKNKQKKCFSLHLGPPIGFGTLSKPLKHDSLFDPDTLLESSTSFQAFFLGRFHFLKSVPHGEGYKI